MCPGVPRRPLPGVVLVAERQLDRPARRLLHLTAQLRDPRPVLLVRRAHQQRQQVAQRVHRHVGLAPLAPLGPVVAGPAADLGRALQRAAVEHRPPRAPRGGPTAPGGCGSIRRTPALQRPAALNDCGRYREAFLIRAPLTDLFTQPFEGHNRSVANEAEHSANFFAAAREHSPDVQPWLYSQWPVKSGSGNWADATWPEEEAPAGVKPAGGDYAAGCENHLRYFEAVRAAINKTWAGKPVLIVPTARAMAEAKRAVEAGKVPGLSDFGDFYSDDLHLSPKGRWFVANVVAACLGRESPEGKTSVLNSGLTEAQAKVLQAIAWDVVSGYEYAGIKK